VQPLMLVLEHQRKYQTPKRWSSKAKVNSQKNMV